MSTDLSHVRLGTSSWAYEGWQGLVYQRAYPKSRFSQDTLAEYAGYEMDGIPLFRTVGIDHSFYRPASATQLAHYARQVSDDFRFCSKVYGKRSPSRPLRIFPATEPKPGNPIHDFLISARFGTWCGRRHKRVWDRNLVRSFLSFSTGAWSLPPFLKRWTDFSAHCHQDHSTQQKFATPQFLDRVT